MLTFLPRPLLGALQISISTAYMSCGCVRVGRPSSIMAERIAISAGRASSRRQSRRLTVSFADIEEIIAGASEYSVYSVTEQLRRGFVTGAAGERIGLAGVFVYEDEKSFTVRT